MGVVDFPQQGTIGANLLPKRYDIEIYQGDTFEVALNFKDGNQNPVDLTGFVGTVQFKNSQGTVMASPTVTVNEGGILGRVLITLLDTSVLPEGSYSWDLQLSDGTRHRTYIGGRVVVTEDVTE